MRSEMYNSQALIFVPGHFTKLSPLPDTITDATRIGAVLTNPQLCGYDPQRVTMLTGEQATLAKFRDALDRLREQDLSNATTIVYISTHGAHLSDDNSPVYLCPHEADPDDLIGTALAGDELSQRLAKIATKRVLIIIDACYAGGAVMLKNGAPIGPPGELSKGIIATLNTGSGKVAMASSHRTQQSEMFAPGGMSLFTYHLIQGLEGQAAFLGGDVIRVFELCAYVSSAMRNAAHQPVFSVLDMENFPVALAQGGKKSVRLITSAPMNSLRDVLIDDPEQGARELRSYLAALPANVTTQLGYSAKDIDIGLFNYRKWDHKIKILGHHSNWMAEQMLILYEWLAIVYKIDGSDQ